MSLLESNQVRQFWFIGPSNPTPADDNTLGYERGIRWLNTSTLRVWVCVDDSTGAAVWREDTPATIDATSAPGGGVKGVATYDENKGLHVNGSTVAEVKVDGISVFFDGFGRLAASGTTADFDKIVTAKYTGVHSTRYAHEVPLVVIDNAGNVVSQA